MMIMVTKTKVKIDFSAPHQEYFVNGQQVAGTTTALRELNKPALLWWAWKEGKEGRSLNQKRDAAANIGTIAHEILCGRDKGYQIDNSNIAPDAWKAALDCVASYDSWAKGMDIKTLGAEVQLVSETYLYGGTLDKIAEVNGVPTLIDYKTGKSIYEEYFYQLAAYSQLAIENGYGIQKAIIVNIPKSSEDNFKVESMPVKSLFEHGYLDVFLGALKIYYAKKQIKDYRNGDKKDDFYEYTKEVSD